MDALRSYSIGPIKDQTSVRACLGNKKRLNRTRKRAETISNVEPTIKQEFEKVTIDHYFKVHLEGI